MFEKKKLPYLVAAFVASIIIGVGIFMMMSPESQASEATKTVYVPSRDIGMYEDISMEKLKGVTVGAQEDTTNYATEPGQLIGKVATTKLFENSLIPQKGVTVANKIADVVFVTIHTDFTRSGGTRAGDIVDVYQVNKEVQNNVKKVEKALVCQDVRVVAVTDLKGSIANKETNSANPIAAATTTQVQAVRLAVKPTDAPNLVEGAVDPENGYVLVLKYGKQEAQKPVVVETPVTEEKKEDSATENNTGIQKTNNQ